MGMKKEVYYTKENAAQKSTEWKSECDLIKKHKPFQYTAKSSALLVLDMQEFFLSSDSHAFVPSAPNIIPNIQELLQNFNLEIIRTKNYLNNAVHL